MKVVNMREFGRRGVVVVDRSTVLGNCFVIGRDGNREEVIEKYKVWLWRQIKGGNTQVLEALRSLNEGDLVGCWCKPLACHADVVVAAARWLKSQGA